jgi:IS5 family transposase
LTDERGTPLGYTIVNANEHEHEPLADLLTGTPAQVVIADKGFWGRGYRERLAADGIRLFTPDKTRTAANHGRERALASTRLVIESVFANPKGQMRLEQHSPKHQPDWPSGSPNASSPHYRDPAQHPQRRPARALAAYDGR